MSDDIFDDKQTPPVVTPPSSTVLPDHLKELIGEGKKYASVEKALESLPHAQSHIQKIEDENKQLREKMAEAIAAEEVYKKLMESNERRSEVTTSPAGLDEASVASLLERKLAEREALATATTNTQRVKEALLTKFGEKAKEVYEAKAKELGVGVDFLNDVVKKSPRAAEELFGIKGKEASASTTTGGINTSTLNTNRPPSGASAKVKNNTTEALVDAWRAAKPE